MKLLLKALTLGVLSFAVAGQFAAHAQGFGGGGGYNQPNTVRGTVTATDTTANTITVQGRDQSVAPVVLKVTPDTTFTKQITAQLTDITVGGFVTVRASDDIPAGSTTVAAQQLSILPALPPAPAAGTNNPYAARSLSGTVLTTSPGLTIKTADGTTVTVTTDDTTRISKTIPAAFTDVAVGNYLQVTTSDDGVTAKVVRIVPARRPRPTQ